MYGFKRGTDPCPKCGQAKMKRSRLCLACCKAIMFKKDLCSCGNEKQVGSLVCRSCSKKSTNNKVLCSCGSKKDKRSKLCRSCASALLRQRPCPCCGKPYSDGEFSIRSDGRRRGQCKSCDSKNAIVWRRNNPEKAKQMKTDYYKKNIKKERIKARIKRLVRTGNDKGHLSLLIDNHDGKCDICRSKMPGGAGTFNIDHDHATGKARGLLCSSCNLGLGKFKDNTSFLIMAIEYLSKYSSLGIGPKCRAAEEKDEAEFLEDMDRWNIEGDNDSYPCVKMGDINRLLGIIRRLKNG